MRYWGIIAVLLIGTAACLYRIEVPAYWGDEVANLKYSERWDDMWQRLFSQEANMWLYYIQTYFWQQGGQNPFYIRCLSAGFALLSIAATYPLGKRLFNTKIALIACLCLALSPFFFRYAQESRGYSETIFWTIISSYLILRAQGQQTRSSWNWYILSIILGLHTHYWIGFVCLSHALWILSLPRSQQHWPNLYWTAGLITLTSIGIVAIQPVLGNQQTDWILPFKWQNLVALGYDFAGKNDALAYIYTLGLIIAGGYFFLQKAEAKQRFLWFWLITPIASTILLSILVKPFFISRYLILVLPACILLITFALFQLSKPLQAMGIIAIIGLSWMTIRENSRERTLRYGDPPQMAQYISQHPYPDEAIVFYGEAFKIAQMYYIYINNITAPVYPIDRELSPVPQIERLEAAQHQHLWVWVDYSRSSFSARLRTYLEENYTLLGVHTFRRGILLEHQLIQKD